MLLHNAGCTPPFRGESDFRPLIQPDREGRRKADNHSGRRHISHMRYGVPTRAANMPAGNMSISLHNAGTGKSREVNTRRARIVSWLFCFSIQGLNWRNEVNAPVNFHEPFE